MEEGRDVWWHRELEYVNADCPAVPLDSEHPLFILYTSGSTGKPKGILHTTGGYLVGAYCTCKYVFDLRDEDIYWCTADIGWVTGHSYVVYGPLAAGATSLMYEGAPNWPEPDRFWRLIEDHRRKHSLHRPDSHPRIHSLGRSMGQEARSVIASPAWIGRRTNQSRSLDVVSEEHRWRSLPNRRYLVADGDRRDHDHAVARRHSQPSREARHCRFSASTPPSSMTTARKSRQMSAAN